MISLNSTKGQRNKGFTIVELLIVIVVIGILALLVITTYSGIQQKARNSKRQTDIQAIQTQLEAYYSQNGHYPSRTNLNSETWRKGTATVEANMKSLDAGALTDPSSKTATLAATLPTEGKVYAYAVFASDGTTACEANEGADCAVYTLSAKYEGKVNGETEYKKVNLD